MDSSEQRAFEREVGRFLLEYKQSWNERVDPYAFSRLFDPQGTLETSDGKHIVGRNEILNYRTEFSRFDSKWKRIVDIEIITISKTICVMDGMDIYSLIIAVLPAGNLTDDFHMLHLTIQWGGQWVGILYQQEANHLKERAS